MASNGINGVTSKGKTVIHFNFFDSYPQELGQLMSWYIQKQITSDLRRRLSGVKLVEDPLRFAELHKIYGDRYASSRILRPQYDDTWTMRALFERIQGIAWIMEIQAGRLKHVFHEPEFVKSHSCRYGYILNLDDQTLDYYVGQGNQASQHSAYSIFPVEIGFLTDVYPLQLIQRFPFSMIQSSNDVTEIISLMMDYEELERMGSQYPLLYKSKLIHAI